MRWDMALVTRLTAPDALTSSERDGENIYYVNNSENSSLAGLVLCSNEGLLFRLDLLKLLGPAGSSWGGHSCRYWTSKWSQNCSAPLPPAQVQAVPPLLATDNLKHLLYYQASVLMPTLTAAFSASQGWMAFPFYKGSGSWPVESYLQFLAP